MFENGLCPASIYAFGHLFNAFCVLGTGLGARTASQDGDVSEGPSSDRRGCPHGGSHTTPDTARPQSSLSAPDSRLW